MRAVKRGDATIVCSLRASIRNIFLPTLAQRPGSAWAAANVCGGQAAWACGAWRAARRPRRAGGNESDGRRPGRQKSRGRAEGRRLGEASEGQPSHTGPWPPPPNRREHQQQQSVAASAASPSSSSPIPRLLSSLAINCSRRYDDPFPQPQQPTNLLTALLSIAYVHAADSQHRPLHHQT